MRGERETGALLFVGDPCYVCRQEEFLPLMCSECRHKFCSAHAPPSEHACAQGQKDTLVPLCPLCEEPPRGWVRGEAPFAVQRRIQAHWVAPSVAQGGCRILLADGPASATRRPTPRCHYGTCKRVLLVAVECPNCTENYCLAHRAPAQHACPVRVAQARNATQTGTHAALKSSIFAGLAGNDRALPATAQPATGTVRTPQQARPSKTTLRRAHAEHASMIHAMKARNERGLLSEAEQIKLAELLAADAATARRSPKPACPIA